MLLSILVKLYAEFILKSPIHSNGSGYYLWVLQATKLGRLGLSLKYDAIHSNGSGQVLYKFHLIWCNYFQFGTNWNKLSSRSITESNFQSCYLADPPHPKWRHLCGTFIRKYTANKFAVIYRDTCLSKWKIPILELNEKRDKSSFGYQKAT